MIFGKKKKDFEARVSDMNYKVVLDALKSILNTEVKKVLDGKEVPDWALTVSSVRMKARVALDFVDGLGDGLGKENKKGV